ncbi:MAG: NUDIX hydrolase, partial [Actinomycetota bacterium]|nr:NUDIX hydrolase [Actinomycetota bacterium]
MSKTGIPSSDADVVAAGVVAWRARKPAVGTEVVVVHRPRYDDWSLPKGKLDAGETVAHAAVREAAEETGYRVRLGARLGETRYRVPAGEKLVHYWAAEALGGKFSPNDEVDELRWLLPGPAAELLSYDWDRTVLERFLELGATAPSVLLVRHAKAGSRSSWPGTDALRPLSTAGHRQARALCGLLVLFQP